jgi:hypothetical protein
MCAINCTFYQIKIEWQKQEECHGRGVWQVWGRREIYSAGILCGNLKQRDSLEDLARNGHKMKINLKQIGGKGVIWTNLA